MLSKFHIISRMRLFGKSAWGGAEGIRGRTAYNFSEYLRQTDRKRTALWRAKAPTEQPAFFKAGNLSGQETEQTGGGASVLLYFFVTEREGK